MLLWMDAEQLNLSYTASRNVRWLSYSERLSGIFLIQLNTVII